MAQQSRASWPPSRHSFAASATAQSDILLLTDKTLSNEAQVLGLESANFGSRHSANVDGT